MGLAAGLGLAEVALSATAILESVAIVGTVVSVVGAVTKNPLLSKIGLGLGLVGGIGALASGALGLSSTALFGTQAATDTTATLGTVDTIGSLGAESLTQAGVDGVAAPLGNIGSLGAGETLTQAASSGASVADAGGAALAGTVSPSTAASPTIAAATDPATAAPANPTPTPGVTPAPAASSSAAVTPGSPAAATSTATPASNATNAVTPAGSQPLTTAPLTTSGSPTSALTTSATTGTPVTATPAAEPGLLDKLVSYVGKNPTIGFGALQGVSSLLGGWTSTLTPAQVALANAQAANNQAAANLATQQQQNLASPRAVASVSPVTGTPATLVPALQQQPGFINTAALPAVTGKVA